MQIETDIEASIMSNQPYLIDASTSYINPREKDAQSKVTERLYKDAAMRAERMKKAKQEEDYQFHPEIISRKGSCGLFQCESSLTKELKKDFNQRQELYESAKYMKGKNSYNDEKCTFRPEINTTSKFITEEGRAQETEEERINRLSRKDPKKEQKLKQKYEKEFKEIYSHRPKINQRSMSFVSEKSWSKAKTPVKKNLMQPNIEDYSFQPLINQHVKAKSTYSLYNDIMGKIRENQKECENKRALEKKSKEYDELKHCSFQPNINNLSGNINSAAVNGKVNL